MQMKHCRGVSELWKFIGPSGTSGRWESELFLQLAQTPMQQAVHFKLPFSPDPPWWKLHRRRKTEAAVNRRSERQRLVNSVDHTTAQALICCSASITRSLCGIKAQAFIQKRSWSSHSPFILCLRAGPDYQSKAFRNLVINKVPWKTDPIDIRIEIGSLERWICFWGRRKEVKFDGCIRIWRC